MDQKKTYEAKIITLGDSMVGKSCLILRYLDNTFSKSYLSTIGFDIKKKIIKVGNGERLKLVIHDTAGQERFKSLSANYIKKANGVLIIYDITNKQSFINVENWVKCVKDEITKKIPIYLIGNKSDLENQRVINSEDGENMAEQFGLKFYETSCMNGTNVEKCFNELGNDIYKNISKEEHKESKVKNMERNISIQIDESSKKKKCC